jgi:ABC-type protease/lipase transport system fused ATPase/permease subunit
MRRTFQDLSRTARVHDFVVRAISGHATAVMQERYSSVAGEEVRASLAKVISLLGWPVRRG